MMSNPLESAPEISATVLQRQVPNIKSLFLYAFAIIRGKEDYTRWYDHKEYKLIFGKEFEPMLQQAYKEWVNRLAPNGGDRSKFFDPELPDGYTCWCQVIEHFLSLSGFVSVSCGDYKRDRYVCKNYKLLQRMVPKINLEQYE